MADFEIKSSEQLAKVLHDISERTAEDINNTRSMVEDVKSALKDQRQEIEAIGRARHAAEIRNGRDSEVVRAFVPEDTGEIKSHKVGNAQTVLDSSAGRCFYGNENGVVRMLGETDRETGEFIPGLLDSDHVESEWHDKAQKLFGDISLYRAATGKKRAPKLTRRFMAHMRRGPEAIARVFADNAGEGGEFIGDVFVPDLAREMRLPVTAAGLFRRTMTGSGGTTTNPFLTTGAQPFLAGVPASGDLDPADLQKSVPVTASRTHSPQTMAVNIPVNRDAEEDSFIEWGAFGRSLVLEALRDGEEDALINGDTGTHGDTGIASWAGPNSRWSTTGSSADHRYAWVGLRHRAIDVSASTDKNAAQAYTDYMLWRSSLASAHKQLDGLVYILNLDNVIAKLLTDSNALTVDKYGPAATILTGEVMRIGGVPVVISEYMTADLATSGLYTGSGSTTGGLLVNRNRFEWVERRGARVEVEQRPTQHTNYFVASLRETFRTVDGASTKNVFYGYNLSAS